MLIHSDSTLLLVDSDLAQPEFLNELREAGLRFVIDAPPTRGEDFRAIRTRDGGRYWTNDAATSPQLIAREATRFEACREATSLFWNEVGTKRLAAPLATSHDLEDALTIAAGVGLAQIAWDLWREDEETHPVLTLDRFRDLSGVVRFTPEKVTVTVPLGRRAMDLSARGYLDDIREVPWLHGRNITFSQG
jgi:hypothetical protein